MSNEIKKNDEDCLLFVRIKEAKSKFKEKNYLEALNVLSSLLTKNIDVLSLRAQIYYEIYEYYKSFNDCLNCLSIFPNDLGMNQLMVKNYIKMFDFEKAREFLTKCMKISKGDKVNTELENLLNDIEKVNKEKCKKYNQYIFYLNFMKALYHNGIYINKAEVCFNSETNRSVISSNNIEEGEIIVRIPLNILITLDGARSAELGKYFTPELEKKLNSPHHSILSTFILNELNKGDKSKWKFYFDFLPKGYENYPIFYGEKEFDLLKGSQFLDIINKKKKEMKEDYDLLCKVIPGYETFSYKQFCIVREIVSSRIFGININNQKNDAIAPFADMLNHKRPKQTHWNFEDSLNCFVIKAITNIEKGNEIFDSYGIKCNTRFLLNYGFTIENNEDNEFKTSLTLDKTYPLYDQKVDFLSVKNLTKYFTLVIEPLDVKNIAYLNYLRFLTYENTNFILSNTNKPINKKSEVSLFLKLKQIMLGYMNKYPNNLDTDEKFFYKNKSSLDFNTYNCYVIRIGEQRILYGLYEMADEILKLLSQNNEAIIEYINSLNYNKKDKLYKYKEYLRYYLQILEE